MKRFFALLLLATGTVAAGADISNSDVIMNAMQDELDRSRTLRITGLDMPYHIEYVVNDLASFNVIASLGALIQSGEGQMRIPTVKVRVGDYAFDNTNAVFTDAAAGSRYDSEQMAIDDDYGVLRRDLWLATDRSYRSASLAIGRKKAALKNMTQVDQLPDFWKAPPAVVSQSPVHFSLDKKKWENKVRSLSAIFLDHPMVRSSSVAFSSNNSVRYMVNSEGTRIRVPEPLSTLQIRALAYTVDGTIVRDAVSLLAETPDRLPSEAELKQATERVATNVEALLGAPLGEAYSGPVLFEGTAAGQLIAELLGSDLGLTRKPISDPRRPAPFRASELEGRIGSRILPEFIDVVDDPTRKEFQGQPLEGTYPVDEEGVVPGPVHIVDKGRLTALLLTRQPVKGFESSNGRARLPGLFGARTPVFSNLIVSASESVPAGDLKKKLVEMASARQKPYGILIRKMDYPSSATYDEMRQIAMRAQQAGGSGRLMSIPLLVYRVYPDGKEELIRGLQLRGVSMRSLRDISAASSESYVFHFLNNLAPFAAMGAGGFVAPSSVVAPSLLFEELELARPQEDRPNAPLVPAPPVQASR